MSHQPAIREEELKNRVAALFFGKYDNFVPEVLLRKQFAADRLDTSFELL